VGEHRVDQVAARKQPVPRPLDGPVEVLRPRPSPGASVHRKGLRSASYRWRQRFARFLRSSKGRWTLVALACLAVLLVGLLAQGFFSSPAPSVALPQANGDSSGAGIGALTPSPSPSKGKPGKNGDGPLVNDPVGQLRNVLPDNPLNHLVTGQLHDVTVAATSSDPTIPVLGYLVPTGLGAAYGSLNGHRSGWSLHQQALGKGYLAAIFIQAGKTGAPVTCTVTVDGRVTSSQTTSGPYGRAVCLG
jgi:hypothetical protein